MAGLPLREEVSGSPEVEISLTDGKARARFAELLQYGQALFGLFGVRLSQQIRKGTDATSSYPAPELMKLGQTELLGPADEFRRRSASHSPD